MDYPGHSWGGTNPDSQHVVAGRSLLHYTGQCAQTHRIADWSQRKYISTICDLSAFVCLCVCKFPDSFVLTQAGDAKFASTEHWTLGRIRSHKFLSVNSHEVQRRLDNLAERFANANYDPYASRLGQLCESLRSHPLCADHYETDIYWVVMHFLLEVARNPVAGLAANRSRIALCDAVVDKTPAASSGPDPLLVALLEDNFEATGWEDGAREELSVSS